VRARVVITGAGTINPLGTSVAKTYAAFREGRGAIAPLDIQDLDRLSIRIGAQVRGFDPAVEFSVREVGLYDRFAAFAVYAARQAVAQSGLRLDGALAETSGVILGNAGGGLASSEASYRAVFAEGNSRVHPFTVPRLMANSAAAHVSIAHGLQGPTYTVASACAASNHAMGQAFHLIRSGAAKVMLTGGSEAMLTFGGIKAWEGLRVLSPEACRPFCATRSGMVMGEGAAVFVFEDRDHALARGAVILAEVAGFGMGADASDIVMPDEGGAVRAMQAALRDGGLMAEDIGYINAHGTGTRANDRVESAAIRRVFGDRTPVSSTKAAHGHLIGGTGAVELLACLLALQEGVLAPTLGHRTPDPACALDLVAGSARQARVSACLSNAFAFGGMNAVLALRRSA
jgi:nodulation protein E